MRRSTMTPDTDSPRASRYDVAVYLVLGLLGLVLVIIPTVSGRASVSDLLLNMGAALVGAAVVFLVLRAFVLDTDRRFEDKIDALLSSVDSTNTVRFALRQSASLGDVADRLRSAGDIALCGYALDRALDELEDLLVDCLTHGARLRLLVVSDVAQSGKLIRIVSGTPNATHNVQRTAAVVRQIQRRVQESGGSPEAIEMRAMNWIPSCAMYVLRGEPSLPSQGWMRVEIYPPAYNTSPGSRPVFTLDSYRQPDWFRVFETQFEALWTSPESTILVGTANVSKTET
jgi:hypothetical protein